MRLIQPLRDRLRSLTEQGRALLAAATTLVAFLGVIALVGAGPADVPLTGAPPGAEPAGAEEPGVLVLEAADPPLEVRRPRTLPGGGRRIFAGGRFLVAYYGTAGTGSLGVLGETSIARADQRLRRAAAPFRRRGERIQPVYELIVTVADRVPGPDGDYSHDIPRERVRELIDAAHRHGALVVLDVQPGRSGFLAVVRRWAWALEDPWVGLALDPEWRLGPRQVPGRAIGRVGADEVNRTAAWLSRLTREHRLPQKPLVIHQFRTSMLPDIGRIRPQPGLVMIQHVDGFGTQRQKLATYHAVARPRQFALGLKLFYDEDRHLMRPARVRQIRPAVRYVSYQ